jgi:hypothetical protein
MFSLTANSSLTLTVSNGFRGIFVYNGIQSVLKGLAIVNVTGSGSPSLSTVFGGTAYEVTTATNKITIKNTTGNNGSLTVINQAGTIS